MSRETMWVDVYTEEVPEYNIDDYQFVQIKTYTELIYNWFKSNILRDFRGDDMETTNKGLFEEWLDEYTCDDTIDLYVWLVQQNAVLEMEGV